jgi:hypothetical protein
MMAWMQSSVDFSSRQVNAEIKRKVWPALRAAGFDKFNARNGWRHASDSIAVVNFQSFSSHHAERNKCTSFSFCVNLGVYYPCVHDTPWAAKWPVLYRVRPSEPPEFGCHARLHLEKRIAQPEYPHLGIWYVRPDGSNLVDVIEDALSVIVDIGLPWLEKVTRLPYALAEYQRPRELNRTEYVSAFGTLAAAEAGSAIAFLLNELEAAMALWESVATSDYYSRFPETLEQARSILSALNAAQAKTHPA